MEVPLCRHIKTNGLQCSAPQLHGQPYCYFHRRLHANHVPYRRSENPFHRKLAIGGLEDRDSVQMALSVVINALAIGDLEPKLGTAILYGLQLASQNAAGLNHSPYPPHVVRHTELLPDGSELAEDGAMLDLTDHALEGLEEEDDEDDEYDDDLDLRAAAVPDPVPEATPVVTSEIAPEIAPEARPEAASDKLPAAVPAAIPETAPSRDPIPLRCDSIHAVAAQVSRRGRPRRASVPNCPAPRFRGGRSIVRVSGSSLSCPGSPYRRSSPSSSSPQTPAAPRSGSRTRSRCQRSTAPVRCP
jgi:hypothetical protein